MKTTSATGTRRLRRSQGGFTLLEIALVVLVLVAAFGALVPLIGKSIENEGVRKIGREIEEMARAARLQALKSGVATQVRITPQGLSYIGGTADEEEAPKNITVPKGTLCKIMRWGEQKWRNPDEDIWVFQPGGLVEPVQFRVQRDEAWLELVFGPVTGEPDETRYYFP